ncbi:MAG TPA: SUMF1/EgtB/PvdO family nonheme iron enzyme [Novosphingobium sp.]|nr:SUMF1/EgtB/PvdO family nonheme iron enzyme [Novosphingobium sp.]
MADVFISYSHQDRAIAANFAALLLDAGFSVWWDDRLGPRKGWDRTIEQELATAAAVLVLWSPTAVESEWVRIEAYHAKQQDKLIPIMVRRCAPPIEFTFSQFLDLDEWSGDTDAAPWRKLLAWLADFRDQPDEATGVVAPKRDNVFRRVLFRLPSGEAVYEGGAIGARTPAGTLFADAEDAPVMRVVPAGGFTMGAEPGDLDRSIQEGPRKGITIAQPFAMAIHPAAPDAFLRFCPGGECRIDARIRPSLLSRLFGGGGGAPEASAAPQPQRDGAVLTSLNFREALDLAAALSTQLGARYRLPSEAEWEYACRAGTTTRYAFGDTAAPGDACFGRSDGPAAPGSFAPNRFGLYDMHGSVREWTQDTWHDSLDFTPADGLPYVDTRSGLRVVRGGCWKDDATRLRSAARSRASEVLRSPEIGVRLLRELER